MIYLQKSKKTRGVMFPVLVVAVFLIFVILAQSFFPSFFGGIFNFLARPLWRSDNFFSQNIRMVGGFLGSRNNLIKENNIFKTELDSVKFLLLDRDILVKENNDLKELFSRTNTSNNILATVLVKPPQSSYDTVILDVGSNLDVKNGNRIFANGSIVLGEIIEVYGQASKAKLYSTAGEKIQVVNVRNNISLEIIGQGGGNFDVMVPREIDIVSGDIFVLPGLFSKILGVVFSIETNPEDSFRHVLLKSPVNISQIKLMLVDTSL